MKKISVYKSSLILNKKGLLGIITCLFFLALGCKKFAEVGIPITNVTEQNVYSSNGTAAAVLTSLYMDLSQDVNYIQAGTSRLFFVAGLLSDELKPYNPLDYHAYYHNDITSYSSPDLFWTAYENIYVTNAAVEGLNKSTGLTPGTKKQLIGEAKFMRAFYYFYLVNLYGEVPLILSTDYTVNMGSPRTATETVYQQIIADLCAADSLMSDKYLDGFATNETSERLRPNKWVAKALLARTYLYTEEWEKAETVASEVISHTALFELLTLDQVFLKNSRETLWALQPVSVGELNAGEGQLFVLPSTGPNGGDYPVYLSDFVLLAFESGDQRKVNWVGAASGFHYPYKYKAGRLETAKIEYSLVFRLAELYLIRAEARIHQDKIAEGITDLNKIRDRATDKSAPATDQLKQLASDLSEDIAIDAVLHERYVELFTEWGHRWLDLKRTNTIDERMKIVTPAKGGVEWKPFQALFPIPLREIQLNAGLAGHQNPGYIE